MDNEMQNNHWPRKGDRVFTEVVGEDDQRYHAYPHHMSNRERDSRISDGYKEAADIIVRSREIEPNRGFPDHLFYPTAYLYRHALELQLKVIVRQGLRMGILVGDEKTDGGHNLMRLWGLAKKTILEFSSEEENEDVRAAERLVQDFHEIDRSGQNFRYFRSTSGTQALSNSLHVVDLRSLMVASAKLNNFLNACECQIDAAWEAVPHEYM